MRRCRYALAGSAGAVVLVVGLTTHAQADVLAALPQHASESELAYSPAYDYDGDSCYTTAAISPDGVLNPGLPLGGDVNGHCHDEAQLAAANTYAREKCNHDWCAVVYASYFEKDQATSGPVAIGHTHDWEHVVVWVSGGEVRYVSVSQHSGYEVAPASSVRFDGTHPKVVYHKDGVSTHAFRFATENDEPPENATGGWFRPPLVGWDGYPDGLRETLVNADFGAATFKLAGDLFVTALTKSMPGGIPFDPNA